MANDDARDLDRVWQHRKVALWCRSNRRKFRRRRRDNRPSRPAKSLRAALAPRCRRRYVNQASPRRRRNCRARCRTSYRCAGRMVPVHPIQLPIWEPDKTSVEATVW